jgi:hypothetical protein
MALCLAPSSVFEVRSSRIYICRYCTTTVLCNLLRTAAESERMRGRHDIGIIIVALLCWHSLKSMYYNQLVVVWNGDSVHILYVV